MYHFYQMDSPAKYEYTDHQEVKTVRALIFNIQLSKKYFFKSRNKHVFI